MRYQDWDVLLYPNHCDVPFKEFRITPYAVQDASVAGFAGESHGNVTPMLTCFTPTLPEGTPFTISVHSWVPPVHVALHAEPRLRERAQWEIKITVDGVVIRTLHFPVDSSWPIVIVQPRVPFPGNLPLMTWPKFYKSAISSREWDASDSAGRIKVELSAGVRDELDGKSVFTKLETLVCFSFFPVPNEHLERCGIAWPNSAMFENPLIPRQHVASNVSGLTFSGMEGGIHKRNYSNGSANNLSSPIHGMPHPPPPSPAWGFYNFRGLQPTHDVPAMNDTRGMTLPVGVTSEQIVNALGSLSNPAPGPVQGSMPGIMSLPPISNFSQNTNSQVQVRLPSDQLQKLISALKSNTQHETQLPTQNEAMPPPPLPPHALAAKGGFVSQDMLPGASHGEHYPATGTTIRNPGPRDESQGSDVSMHTACAYFPGCTTEDDTGHVVHTSPATPSTIIKGKKEGSSPIKPRDFMSTILGPQENDAMAFSAAAERSSTLLSSSPAETPGRKRTRAALRAMSLNDGSPERIDASASRRPSRKVSRASSGGSKKGKDDVSSSVELDFKTAMSNDEDKENQMAIDA